MPASCTAHRLAVSEAVVGTTYFPTFFSALYSINRFNMFDWFGCRTPEIEETRSVPESSNGSMSEKRDLEQRFSMSSIGQELPAYSQTGHAEDDTRATCVLSVSSLAICLIPLCHDSIADKIDALSKELRALSLDMHDHVLRDTIKLQYTR